MAQPTRQDVATLASYDEEKFTRWLLSGFYGYLLEDGKGRHAFGRLRTFIGLEPDLVQDLVNLYRLLEPTEQITFRAGLVMALARTPLTEPTIVVIETMLNLASEIGATEILPVISEKHRFNWIVAEVDDEELLDATLRCVVSLTTNAGPTSQAQTNFSLLTDFAEAEALPPEYAEPVLIAMCRVRPEDAWRNFLILRDHLDRELAPPSEEVDDQRRAKLRRGLVNRMFQTVGGANFRRMLIDAIGGTSSYEREWWLTTALAERRKDFVGAHSPPDMPAVRAPRPGAERVEQSLPPAAPISLAANDTMVVFGTRFAASSVGSDLAHMGVGDS